MFTATAGGRTTTIELTPEEVENFSRAPTPARAGIVYCCATLGWVSEAEAFDHRWETSRPLAEYRG